MKESECKKCGYKINKHTPISDENATPLKGDYAVCYNCISICEFDEDLNLIPLTPEQLVELYISDDLTYLDLVKAQNMCKIKDEKDQLVEEFKNKLKSQFGLENLDNIEIIDLTDE